MKIVFSSLLILLAISLHAQTDTAKKTQVDSLHVKLPFFRVYPVIYNNGNVLTKSEAIALLSAVPESLERYQKAANRHRIGLYSYAGFFAGLSASAIGFDKGSRGLVGIGLTAGILSLYSSIYFLVSADASARKAVKKYNQYQLLY